MEASRTFRAMLIRREGIHDHEAVRSIHRSAFGGAHGESVAGLVDALRHDDPHAASFVAERAGKVVGHVMFSRGLLDAPRRLVAVTTLAPLAVAPGWQHRGAGSALIHHGLTEMENQESPLVFVEGDPRYYSRAGFTPAGEQGFRKPSLRIPDQAFQVVKLSAYEPWMTGTYVYSDTFWRHDSVGLREDSP